MGRGGGKKGGLAGGGIGVSHGKGVWRERERLLLGDGRAWGGRSEGVG